MNTTEKLKIILKVSGLTQDQLARRLGVTFAAFNRWINERAVPRKKSQAKIDELYKEYTGQKVIPQTVLEAKKKLIRKRQKSHQNIVEEIISNPDIRDQLYLSLTYNSNRIEGSTLSEAETAAVLFENVALSNKSLTEQMEAKNHQAALDFLLSSISRKQHIDEKLILGLHQILLNAVHPNAGQYRKHGVRIMGTSVPTANYLKIPQLMSTLMNRADTRHRDTIFNITKIHAEFEQIHPFADGNGRVGRLLMHAMALKANLPPPAVLQERRQEYIRYLNKAQLKQDWSQLQDLISDSILTSFEIVERKFQK